MVAADGNYFFISSSTTSVAIIIIKLPRVLDVL